MKANKMELTVTTRKIWDKLKNNKYVLLVILIGLVLILIPSGKNVQSKEAAGTESTAPYENVFTLEGEEKKLEEILSKVNGAGKVQVMLTLKTSTEQILAKDEQHASDSSENGDEKSSSEESSVSTVIVSSGSGKESSVTLKYIYPEYLGALVVAEGADSTKVKLELTEAVSSLTGLSTDKITVTKMKGS